MTVTVSPTETQQWIKTRDNRTGRQIVVAVPSKSKPNAYHLVSAADCDCKGFAYRGTCSHRRAVQAEVAKLKAPLADGGAAHLALQRAAGNWPDVSPEIAAKAAEYRSIFGERRMSAVTAPRALARLTGGLTDRGLMVAYSVRLRTTAEPLDEVTRERLLGDLRALVDEYAPRPQRAS